MTTEKKLEEAEAELTAARHELAEAEHDIEAASQKIEELIDIEEFTREHPDRRKPKAHRYAFRVNKKRLETADPLPTREEILTLAGLTPTDNYRLRLKRGKGDPLEVQKGQKVDLTEPGVERFIANKLHVTDGLSERRDFRLPEEDETFLNGLGLRWETVSCEQPGQPNKQLWVLVRDWATPEGFSPATADIAFNVTSYPVGVIDMAFFLPAITRIDGREIPLTEGKISIEGVDWQQWSRHREESVNPWNAATDSLASHYGYMLDWFKRELER